MPDSPTPIPTAPRWRVVLLILGLFLTLRGYHSRDGDQAYRLPLLLHQQDPALFADDPFVRAFDTFNPHRGYLALLDLASRPLGLSAGLAILFGLTFVATYLGLDRLARTVWPERGPRVGVVVVGLVLIAKAGNIGTNHLFEAMLLDRLVGFALGWLALAWVIDRPDRGWWRSGLSIGLAALIHPSVGLQLGMVLVAAWIGWGLCPSATGVGGKRVLRGVGAIGLALVPCVLMNLGQGQRLFEGLPTAEFRLLSVELQGPQHMLPHLWRLPQWLAWACYPVLAIISLAGSGSRDGWPAARVRLAVLLVVNLLGLALAWFAIEVRQDLRVTLFQPFRMATLARGVALVCLGGRVLSLWREGGYLDRSRAALLVVGLVGDWLLVVVTALELTMTAVDAISPASDRKRVARALAFGMVLATGTWFLTKHDTESGQVPLLLTLAAVAGWSAVSRGRVFVWNPRRLTWATLGCWAVPMAALVVAALPADRSGKRPKWAEAVCGRCRFAAVPLDDLERLAIWCRDNTPRSARFIGPPGPKTFRLWSLRSVAFNRAGSPYHASGLADWAERFRDHVGFRGPTESFVRAYQADRHGLEGRYQAMSDAGRARLAVGQGASYVVAAPPAKSQAEGPLELLHVEGRYAVYRVRAASKPSPAQVRAAATASAGTG